MLLHLYLDFGAMQTDVSNGILCLVESKENGIDFICYLESADNVGQNVQKDAGSIADPESHSSNHQ